MFLRQLIKITTTTVATGDYVPLYEKITTKVIATPNFVVTLYAHSLRSKTVHTAPTQR